MFLVSLFQRPDDVSLWFLRQGSYARSRQSDKGKGCDCDRGDGPRKNSDRTSVKSKPASSVQTASLGNVEAQSHRVTAVSLKPPSKQFQESSLTGGDSTGYEYAYDYVTETEKASSEPINIEIELDESESIVSETLTGTTPTQYSRSGSVSRTLTPSKSPEKQPRRPADATEAPAVGTGNEGHI